MDTLGVILVLILLLFLANIVTGVACVIISRTRSVAGWLRVLAGVLIVLDLPPILIVLPGIFGPAHDEILGMGEGWRLFAITIFLLFLLPGAFLYWSAFKRDGPRTR